MGSFNRFGNMSPPPELLRRSYLMYEEPFHIVGNVYCRKYLVLLSSD